MIFLLISLIASAVAEKPLLIIDFDDTLFPTTHLVRLGAAISEGDHRELISAVKLFLEKAKEIGEVVILTASCPVKDWVGSCVERVYPDLVDLFRTVPVIYSRDSLNLTSLYDELELGNKEPCLERLLSGIDSAVSADDGSRVVISLSDAPRDIDSFGAACAGFNKLICRSVQFKVNPLTNQLTEQLVAVTGMLDLIATSYPTAKLVPYAIRTIHGKNLILRGPLNRMSQVPESLPTDMRTLTAKDGLLSLP